MALINFLRSILVLIATPIMTLIVCLWTMVQIGIFHGSASSVQFLPRIWGKIIVFLSGVSVNVVGREKLEIGKPYIFAANHQSQFDIFALQGFLDLDFRWMAKKELFQIPIFGKAMLNAGYISVDRSKGRKALESLNLAAERIAGGTSVIIFPEGTRSPDGNIQRFKSGAMLLAIKAGVPIVPVAISGTHKVLPKGKLLVNGGKVNIAIGNPIETKNFNQKQKQELADQLQSEVSALLEDFG